MNFQGRCYRAHDPKWAFSPLSGEGAAISGGRFNHVGEPTLYLAVDVITAVLECAQGLGGRLLPLTLVEYDVNCDDVIDLRTDETRSQAGVTLAELGCAWLEFKRANQQAPSWKAVDRLKTAGAAGCLVPSFAPGAQGRHSNLVLWDWSADRPHRVLAYDPTDRLPKDQLSWR